MRLINREGDIKQGHKYINAFINEKGFYHSKVEVIYHNGCVVRSFFIDGGYVCKQYISSDDFTILRYNL